MVRRRSRGVALGPLAGGALVPGPVILVHRGDLGHERVVRVRVRQQRADREEDLRDGERGRPLVLEDVEADRAVPVDVRVVNLGRERHLGRLERVVGREVDVQKEDALVIRRVLGAHDRRLPVEAVLLVRGAGQAVRGRVLAKVDELLLDSFKRHNLVYNTLPFLSNSSGPVRRPLIKFANIPSPHSLSHI